jgi:hypothetical protein
MEVARKAEIEKVQSILDFSTLPDQPSKLEKPPTPAEDTLYEEGLTRQKVRGQVGAIRISISPAIIKFNTNIKDRWDTFHKGWIEPFRFKKKGVPAQLTDDYRTEVIGGLNRLMQLRDRHKVALFGGMDEVDIAKTAELIYARDELARTQVHRGNPDKTLAQVQTELFGIESSASQPVKDAANRWRTIENEYFNELVRRDKLDPNNRFSDYAHHFVEDYTPEWAPAFSMNRLRRPLRGYTKQAKGSIKEYRQDAESLLDYLTMVDYENMMEDFMIKQATKYDIGPTLTRDQKIEIFGVTESGRLKPWARPGKIVDINGEKYRAWTPDKPYSQQIYHVETADGKEVPAIGRPKKTYLLPQDIYNYFENLSPKGSKAWYLLNQATSYFKSSAILSTFPKFNINNLIGDTWMIMMQHPEPMKFLGHLDDAIGLLVKRKANYNTLDKALEEFLTSKDILQAGFFHELPHIKGTHNPIKYILQKSQFVSQFRESIERAANARYLFLETHDLTPQGTYVLNPTKARRIIKQFDWIDTKGLKPLSALGKIAREVLIDYESNSKVYNRVIRGAIFPFGTWYFKGTKLIWDYGVKHPFKALSGLALLPAMFVALNNRDEKTRKLEGQLPDEVRMKMHYIIGESATGKIKVWSMQLPPDALIGTKIFSIAADQANRYINGEKTISKAAIDMIKNTGVKETEGIAFLTSPVIRFISGLASKKRKDPFDGAQIFPEIDMRRLSDTEYAWDISKYFVKCMQPFLSITIREYDKLKPPEKAIMKQVENWIGLRALGIYEYDPKTQIFFRDGQKIDYESMEKMDKVLQGETQILRRIERDYVSKGEMMDKFLVSPEFISHIKDLSTLHGGNLDKSLRDRIMNAIDNPFTFSMWLDNRIDNAPTDEEKKKLNELKNKGVKTFMMFEKITKYPKSVRPHLFEK